MTTEITLSRNLKIGQSTIGLLGLDQALAVALREAMAEDKAVAYIFQEIAAKNYIPPEAKTPYQEAIRGEFRRQTGHDETTTKGLTIRILGPGCVSCNRINAMVFDILQKLNLAADTEQIHDLDEIWRHGVINTPALIINDEIKTSGRHPSRSEIEQWLREATD